jgi:small subunit ribosomal protein S21
LGPVLGYASAAALTCGAAFFDVEESVPVMQNEEGVSLPSEMDVGAHAERGFGRRAGSERQIVFRPLEVEVKDNLEKAMKALKQKMSKEGVLQELKRRRFYEKPSVKRKRKMREALKRRRKAARKRLQQLG